MANQVVDLLAAEEQRLTMGYEEFLARWGQNHRDERVDGEVIVEV